MKARLPRLLPLVLALLSTACENQSPAALDEQLVPVGPVTVEVRLPWSQFASNLKVLGGFGAPDELLGITFLANRYQGTLDARTLIHLDPFPTSVTVNDSTGTSRLDTELTFVGAKLLVRFDAEASTNAGPVRVSAARTLTPWDAHTATWQLASDTSTSPVPWPEAGGGPVAPLGSEEWNKTLGDSILISLDSAAVATLADTTSDRGIRISVATPGERLQIKFIQMELTTRPSIHQDTLVTLTAAVSNTTFIFNPAPAPPTDGLLVGGVPSWRSVFSLALPATVPGPAEACARVTCPLQLTPERITYAGLVLTTRPVEAAFRPTDSLGVQARAVLAPEVLPKSPVGEALFSDQLGRVIGASVPFAGFAPGTPKTVDVALTPVIQDLARGKTRSGGRPTPAIGLLSLRCPPDLATCTEAGSLSYMSFVGPGKTGEPYLRLVLTLSSRLELP